MKWMWRVLLLLSTVLYGQDIIPARTVIDLEKGAIRISSPDPGAAQTLGVWVRQSLETLERVWDVPMPVQKGVPLELMIQENLEEVRLWERWDSGQLLQRIGIPNDPKRQDPLALADALTRAVSHRHLLSATSGTWVEAPDWWVHGHSLLLLRGGLEGALKARFQGADVELPYPEVLLPRLEAGQGELEDRAQAILFCRWIRQQEGEPFWIWVAKLNERQIPEALQILTGSLDLREVHIRWELWLVADREDLLADVPIPGALLAELENRMQLHPAAFGVSGLSSRYRPFDLEELRGEIDREGMDLLMTRWSLRLQPLGFRQSPEIHEVVKGYVEAGLALRNASTTRGRKRERELEAFQSALSRARKAHHALLLGLEP